MHRLGVYRIRLQKKKYKPPRSRSLRWAVTEGDGDVTRFVSRTLIHQIVSVSGRHRTDSLKESVNHPLTAILSLGVLNV